MGKIKGKWITEKFGKKGEKTGWTYIAFSPEQIEELGPGTRQSFRVKGTLNGVDLQQVAVLPMGDGHFILPLNADLRRRLGVKTGYEVSGQIEMDKSELRISSDLLECLEDAPEAKAFFDSLLFSHQRYFSQWIESAKTAPTKSKRIAKAISALERKMPFNEMLRDIG